MEKHPHELPPQDFSIYLEARDCGVMFYHAAHFSFTDKAGLLVLLPMGSQISDSTLQYIQYFFEDSSCPLVCVPLLAPGEEMPEELLNIPAGGITHDVSLLLRYNFVCATTDPNLLSKGSTAFLQAAINTGQFGVITAISAIGDCPVRRNFCVTDLVEIAEQTGNTHGFVEQYILEQADLPINEADKHIGLLAPYINSSIIGGAVSTITITNATNYFDNIEVTGILTSSDNLQINTSTELVYFDVKRLTETVADKFLTRYSFVCRAELRNAQTEITFSHKVDVCENAARNYDISASGNTLDIRKIAMRPQYKVSCIIPIYNNEEYIKEAIESITSQQLDFYQHIQIVLVNDGSSDAVHSTCQAIAERHEYNVVYVRQEKRGVSAARNTGLRYAMGDYVFFMDADDTLDTSILQLGVQYLEGNDNANIDFIAFPLKMFGSENAPAPDLEFRFAQNGIIDLRVEPQKPQFSACGVLMRSSALDGIRFDETLPFSEDVDFMTRAMATKMEYLVCRDAFYNYRVSWGKYKENTGQYGGTAPFATSLAAFFANRGEDIADYAQYAILYDILRAFGSTAGEIETLPENQADAMRMQIEKFQFHSVLAKIAVALSYVDDSYITQVRRLSPIEREYLLTLKHGGATGFDAVSIVDDMFMVGGYELRNLNTELCVDYVRGHDGDLLVYGHFYMPSYDGVTLVASINGNEYTAALYPDERFSITIFGQAVNSAQAFVLSIPSNSAMDGELTFNFVCKPYGAACQATLVLPENFLFVGKNIVVSPGENCIMTAALDLDILPDLMQNVIDSPDVVQEYIAMHPFISGTRIWLFVDPMAGLVQSGTSLLYDHFVTKRDGVDMYLATSADEADIRNEKSVIAYGSLSFSVLALFAEKIFVSDFAVLQRLKCSRLAADFVFMPQDVLTATDATRLKTLANTPLALISLLYEDERRILPIGHAHAAALVLGNPRYDSLADSGQKRVLIMPSYRTHLYGGASTYNPQFATSEYATVLGDILLNERFLDKADQLGISVDFAPHKKIYLHLSDIERDDSVTVIPHYFDRMDLCRDTALVVTDTLPAFGFAYMGKPVIYFNFDADGTEPADGACFGKTAANFDELIDLLIEYMENGFTVSSEHVAAVDSLFGVRDGMSKERVYAALLGHNMK